MNMLKWLNNKKKDNKGFSIVELIIVVAIMAILVGLLAPQYIKYVEKSRKSADASNLSELVNALQVYAADADENLPADEYYITITKTNTTVTAKTEANSAKAVEAVIATAPDYATISLKSNKWKGLTDAGIKATVKVDENGGTTVSYSPAGDGGVQEFIKGKATN